MKQAKIYAFEGLGWGRFIEKGLLLPLKDAGLQFDYVINNWYQSCPVIKANKIIVLMHSMGAGGFNCLRGTDKMIDLVISMDPRVTGKPYVRPANVKRFLNFYQLGFMRGYLVSGADQNNRVVGVGHTALPRLPAIHAEILKALGTTA